jgi:hypothetical protein
MIADGEAVADLVPDDRRIRLIHLDGDPLSIGEKRNLGCEYANGDVIAHFDDDDFSAAGRVEDQVGRLIETGKAVSGYHSMKFTDGANWWQYKGEHNYSLGTALVYRRDWWAAHRFPALQVGEDAEFAKTAWDAGQLATVNAGELMHASIHPENTSPRSMGSNWEKL